MIVTEEMLAAYADGELDLAVVQEVEAAIAADPALARKVEAHRGLKAMLSAHYAPLVEEGVPPHLATLLAPRDAGGEVDDASGEVVSLAAARQKRGLAPVVRRWAPLVGPALAASLILVLWQPWQGRTPDGYAGGDLATALDTQLASDQPADAPTRILLSFERDGGDLCRAWRNSETGGIACRDITGWKIERQFALGSARATEYRQAGSETDLFAAAQDMAAGGALDAEGERAARERGWKAP
jgi:hypothetical protein